MLSHDLSMGPLIPNSGQQLVRELKTLSHVQNRMESIQKLFSLFNRVFSNKKLFIHFHGILKITAFKKNYNLSSKETLECALP